MTRAEILKDFFKKTVLPVVIACFLFSMFKNIFTEDGQTNYFYVWGDQLLLCMAVLRYSLWYSPYVRMACTAWV